VIHNRQDMMPTTMQILIVDDEVANVELFASFAAGAGRDITTCTSSLEAYSRIAAKPPDLLITDIVMPQLDGLSLVSEARRIDPHFEAIVITGFASRYTLDEVLQCGASDLILKPVRMKEFQARVDLALERRRAFLGHCARHRELQATSAEMIEGLERELVAAARLTGPRGRN